VTEKITCTLSWLFEKYVVHSTDELVEKLKTIPGVLILNLYGSDTIVHVEMDQFARYLLSEIGQELPNPDIDCHSINNNLISLGNRIDDLSDRLEKSLSMNKSGNKSIDKPNYITNETPIEMLKRLTSSGAIMHMNKTKEMLFKLTPRQRESFHALCDLSKGNVIALFGDTNELRVFLDNGTIQSILRGPTEPIETYKAFMLHREMFGNMLRVASPEALCRILNEYTIGREAIYLEFMRMLDRYKLEDDSSVKIKMMRQMLPFVDVQYVADTAHVDRLTQMRTILMEHLGYETKDESVRRKIFELNVAHNKFPNVDRSTIIPPQPAVYKISTDELHLSLNEAISFDEVKLCEKSPAELGKLGEELVWNMLAGEFDNVELVSHEKHVGDIHCENILVEVKNHTNAVVLADKVKFYRDMRENPDMIGGMIVSLKSCIAKSDPLDVGITPDGRYIIYLSNPTLGVLLASVKLLLAGDNISNRRVYVKEIEKYMPDFYNITKLSIAFTGDSTKSTYG
jgi:hypothetical protein